MTPNAAASPKRVREILTRLLREGQAIARADGTLHDLFPVAVSAAEGHAVHRWVRRERAASTIEVGLGYGIAALHVCEGLLENGDPGALHVTIDPHQRTRFAGCGLQFLDEAGLTGMVEFHADESQIVLPRLLAGERRFDLAVVDGNHRFEAVFLDLVYLRRLVHPGGIVFVDDFQLPAIARAVSFFLTNLGWTLEETATEDDLHHWAALRTSPLPDERPFDYFVDF